MNLSGTVSFAFALLALLFFPLVCLRAIHRFAHELLVLRHLVRRKLFDLLGPSLKTSLHPVESPLLVGFNLQAQCLYLHAVLSTLELLVIECEALTPLGAADRAQSITVT